MNLLSPKPPGRFSPERLFRPDSVAVIGATTAEGAQVMANLMEGGFKGAILPVEPGTKAVSGVLAYPDVASLPVAPDLAVIASAPESVAADLEALAAKGVFAAIVISMVPDLAEIAQRTGVRVLGPGSFGLVVTAIGLNASRGHIAPHKGRLALVSQSAGLCRAVLDWAEPNGIGFSHIVGLGSGADLGFAQSLDWLSRDPDTGVILLDIRRVKNWRSFLSAARAAATLRPVIAIRAGGRLLDWSGLADLASEAALRRAGVLTVSALDDLLAAAETLTRARPARGEGLAIVTNAIGLGQLVADAALRDGLSLASLSDATRQVLGISIPQSEATHPNQGAELAGLDGRLIHVGLDAPMRLAETAAMLAGAPEVGGVLVVHTPTGKGDDAAINALAACARTSKVPLLICAMGETSGALHRRALADAGVPAFASPEQAVRGFLYLVQHLRSRAAARELPPSTVLSLAPDRDTARSVLGEVRKSGRLRLTLDEAADVLSAYGIPSVPFRPVATPEDAAAAASLLGFPVVVKLRRNEPSGGASERGGLVLGLQDEAAARGAARSLLSWVPAPGVGAEERACIVQRQAGRSTELLIRVGDDAAFGPTIVFGYGGARAEIIRDFAMDLPPLNLALARALVRRPRVGALLGGFRDMPAANVDALAETLVRVSQLIVDFPEIAELHINPLFADQDGVAVGDAWIRLREHGEAGGDLAISPYPDELVSHWSAKGERLTVRPIRPEDAEQHRAMFGRLSPDDVRFRFFTTIRSLSPQQTARMTQVDYDREMAFVAVRDATGEMVGVSRLACEPDGKSGEFAVIVQADMKGKGLASYLMARLLDWARSRGVETVIGQVLADNAPMLAFVRHLGFQVHRVPGEEDVVEARINLDRPKAA